MRRQLIRQLAEVDPRAIADPDGAGAESGQCRLEFRLQKGALDNYDSATKTSDLLDESLRGLALAHISLRKPPAQHGADRRAIETPSRDNQDDTGHASVPLR